MKKKLIFMGIALSAMASSVMADTLSVTAGVSHLSVDDTPFTANTAYAGVGYEIDVLDTKFSLMPEFRYAIGLDDETFLTQTPSGVFETKIEVERAYMFSLRGNYQITQNVGLFVQPTYSAIKVEVTTKDAMLSGKSENSEWGAGVGFDYDFDAKSSVELVYEQFGDSDSVSLGYRFKF